MATFSPEYLARRVNALLDGERFFEHWRERFRDPRTFGTTIKAQCPFHLGESFHSFILDIKRKTFRCTFTQCKAASGGTFVDLHALLTDKQTLDAILDLCSTFKIRLPADVQTGLTEALAARARRLLAENELEAAEDLAVLALKENPTSGALNLLLAEICERKGNLSDARPFYEACLEEMIAQKNWERADEVLEKLCAAAPDEIAYQARAAEVAEARGDCEKAAERRLRLAGREDAPLEQRIEWLEKAREYAPSRTEVLRKTADLYEAAGRTDEAVAVLEQLARHCQFLGKTDEAAEALERIARLRPEKTDLAEKRAQMFLAAGRREEAASILRALADKALAEGAAAEAARHLRQLCDCCPDDVESHWRWLEVLEEAGSVEDATIVAERLLAIGSPEAVGERYVQALERLKQWHPTKTTYRERLAAYYAKQGEIEKAVEERLAVAEMFFDKGMRAKALECIEAAEALVAGKVERRLDIARFLAAHNCPEEALERFESVARESLPADPALAEQACLGGLAVDEAHKALNDLLLETYLRNRPERALEQCRKVVDVYEQARDPQGAIAIVERVVHFFPEEAEPRLLLVRLEARSGEVEKATADLGEVLKLELSPDQVERAVETANLLLEQQGRNIALLQMVADLQRRRGDTDALVEALLRLAEAQKEAGDSDAAEAAYLEVFAVRPDEADALLGHAELVRSQRGFAAAKPLYQRYVEYLLSAGRGDEAVRIYYRCVEWAPEDVDCRRTLASLLAERGDIEEACEQWEAAATIYLTVHDNPAAAECYEAILARDPENVKIRKALGRLYALLGDTDAAVEAFSRAAEQLAAQGDLEGRIETYTAALSSVPRDKRLRLALADALVAANRKDEACAALEETLRQCEEAAEREQAAAVLRRLVELEPERTDFREHLARLLDELGDRAGAAEQYRFLAEQAERSGDVDRAVEARRSAKECDPADVDNRRALVELYRRRGDLDAVKHELDELAAVWRHVGEPVRAVEVMEERAALDPDDCEHAVLLAQVREEAGRSEEAAQDYCRLSEIFQEKGDDKRARQMLERALKLRPGDNRFRRRLIKLSLREQDPERVAGELEGLAEAFFNTGEKDEGLDCLRQIAKLGRKNLALRLRAANLYAKYGFPDQAREIYDRAISRSKRSGDKEALLEILDLAAADFPEDESLLRRKLEIERELGRSDAAAASAAALARLLRARQAPADEVAALYGTALEAGEPSQEILEEAARFYEEEGRVEDLVAALKKSARLHESRGEIAAAVEQYERICSLRPDDEDTLAALGRLAGESGDKEGAKRWAVRLADVLISREQWDDARSLIAPLVEQGELDEDLITRLIRVVRELGDSEAEDRYNRLWTEYLGDRGRLEEAVRACEEFLEKEPRNPDTYKRLADLYGRMGDRARKVEVLGRLARFCDEAGETDEALAARESIREIEPGNIPNLLALGESYLRAGRPGEAVAVWREAFETATRIGHEKKAVEIAERILECDESQDDVYEKAAGLLAGLEEFQGAADLLSRLGDRKAESDPGAAIEAYQQALHYDPRRAAVRRSLAALLARVGQIDDAVCEYLEAAEQFAHGGQAARGVECLEAVLSLEPDHRQAREMMVRLRLESGEAEKAIIDAVAMADKALAEGNFEDAERILLSAAEAGPDKAALAGERLVDLYMRQGRNEEALSRLGPLVEKARRGSDTSKLIAYLEKICDLVPIDHEHRIELIELNLAQGNFRKALEHFEKILPTLAKIGLMGESDRVGQMILAAAGDDWEIKEEVARAYLRAQVRDLAEMTYLDLASSARGAHDYERVVAYASAALDVAPESRTARELLFEAELALEHKNEAFEHALALSRLYEDEDQSDKALSLARKAIELLPDIPLGYERLSEVLERRGDEEELACVLEQLVDVYVKVSDTPKAVETLGRLLVLRPEDVEVRKRYVELASQLGEESELVEDYMTLIEAAMEKGDTDEAARLFKRVLEIAPDNVDIRDRWVEFLYDQGKFEAGHRALVGICNLLVQQGKLKKAVARLTKAVERFPDAAVLHVNLGELHSTTTAKGSAIACFKQAARLFAESGDLAKYHEMSERILEIDPMDTATRAALVESLLKAGEPEKAIEHSRILADQYAERNLLDLAEREYRRILAHKPEDLPTWKKLLDTVERMGEQRAHVSDYLLVADLMARRGLLDEAARLFRKTIDLDPDNVEARRGYIETYLQIGVERDLLPDYLELADLLASRGRVAEAIEVYERVLKIEPGNKQAEEQLGRLRPDVEKIRPIGVAESAGAGRREQAPSPPKIEKGPPDSADEKILREAIENYREILKSKPENAMVRTRMADLLFQLGRVDEALEEWDTASRIFYEHGELEPAIRLCEKILEIDPGRAGVRDRLSRSTLKKDSMAAIESAIESLEDLDFEFDDDKTSE